MVLTKRDVVILYGLATLLIAVIAWAHSIWFGHVWLHLQIIIPFSFISLGVLIKYGDQSFDEDCFSKDVAKALAVPCGIWMGGLILLDPNSATIFIGILLALLVASKYDNVAFKTGFLVAGALAFVSLLNFPNNASYIGIVIVFMAALVDEKASDWADMKGSLNGIGMVMKERPFLKLAVLGLCVSGILSSYLYFFAFLGFDLGYSFMEKYADWRCHPEAI